MSESSAFVIEVRGRSAGIVVAEAQGYTFFAAEPEFYALDRRHFHTVSHAEKAARDLLPQRRGLGR